jgi:hypothetical protein
MSQVNGDHLMPPLLGILCSQQPLFTPDPCPRNACIIVGTVQPAIGLHGFANHRFDFGGIGDIDPYERRFAPLLCDHVDGLLSTVLVHISNDQFGTFSGKGERSGSTNA